MKSQATKQKPLFGSGHLFENAPYYDPNDLHIHLWVFGPLGREENPKDPYYSNDLINIRNCEYCKICHKINNKFTGSLESEEIIKQDSPAYYPRPSPGPDPSSYGKIEILRIPKRETGDLPDKFSYLFHNQNMDTEYVMF